MTKLLDEKAMGAKRMEGKACVVTGAGQGIGRAAALRLAAEGGKVIVADRAEASARETAKMITDAGCLAIADFADLSSSADADALMRKAKAEFGRIDVLVNVVGGTIWWQPFDKYTDEQIHREFERSLYPTLWCCRAVLGYMREQKSGSIVNISSSITSGGLNRTPYAVSKGGVDVLTKTLAAEYGRYGIRVNAVAPGRTTIPDRVTDRRDLGHGVQAAPVESEADYYKETRTDRPNALQRTGTPAEQAAAIAFLASEDASYVTGHILDCSGGR
jgi:dihydroxycyclohexadiene carboxylate dehydrogenase